MNKHGLCPQQVYYKIRQTDVQTNGNYRVKEAVGGEMRQMRRWWLILPKEWCHFLATTKEFGTYGSILNK